MKSKLLGIFILFQLVYLPLANIIKLVPLGLPESTGELNDDIQLRGRAYPSPIQDVADAAGTTFARWGELTGQAQGWSLFAPVFGHQASLPVVTLGGVLDVSPIRSSFQPADPNVYFRLPSSTCRLFNYEYRLALLYWTWTPESFRTSEVIWQQAVIKRVRRQNRSMLAYMNWQMSAYLRDNPTIAPPTSVQLSAELVPAPPLESITDVRWRITQFPIARWSPGTPTPADSLDVQAMPQWRRFVWLPVEGWP